MEFTKLDYDEQIMASIRNSFKTCREISIDTGLDYNIVSRRLKQLRKENFLYYQLSKKVVPGVKPMKYKLKIIDED